MPLRDRPAGIGCIGQPRIGHCTLPGWLYPASAALFTAFHLAHASIAYSRVFG